MPITTVSLLHLCWQLPAKGIMSVGCPRVHPSVHCEHDIALEALRVCAI